MSEFKRWVQARKVVVIEAPEDVSSIQVARAKERLAMAQSKVQELTKSRDHALAEAKKFEGSWKDWERHANAFAGTLKGWAADIEPAKKALAAAQKGG